MDSSLFFNSRPAAKERQVSEVYKLEIRKNLVHVVSDGLICMTPSRTQQQFKEECDVNNILRNYVSSGVLSHVSDQVLQFGDFSELPSDYGEALALIERSRVEFMTLPSEVRERFDSNPLNLVKFLQDENNREEAEKLGLVEKRVNAEPKLDKVD